MELKQLVEFAILHNLRAARYKDIEIEFFEPVKRDTQQQTIPVEQVRAPSEDEMLFYSTDHFDELRNERDAKN